MLEPVKRESTNQSSTLAALHARLCKYPNELPLSSEMGSYILFPIFKHYFQNNNTPPPSTVWTIIEFLFSRDAVCAQLKQPLLVSALQCQISTYDDSSVLALLSMYGH